MPWRRNRKRNWRLNLLGASESSRTHGIVRATRLAVNCAAVDRRRGAGDYAAHHSPSLGSAALSAGAPMLPAFGLPIEGPPQFNVLPLLLASLVLVLFYPRVGTALHIVTLVVAMLLDQTRMQPWCVSFARLMVGSLDSPGAKSVGRAHLVATWFYAGLHKLLSPGYSHKVVPFLLTGLYDKPNPTLFALLGGAAAAVEVTVAILAIVPRTRRWAAALACVMHLTIALWLALRLGWNADVWPWNIVLAIAALLLIWPWRTTLREDWRACSRVARAAVLLIMISPVGFYFGLVDGFLAHCIYSANTPEAKIVLPDGAEVNIAAVATSINAPMPPAIRLYEEYFRQVGEPGELLVINDPRWWAQFAETSIAKSTSRRIPTSPQRERERRLGSQSNHAAQSNRLKKVSANSWRPCVFKE